MIRFSPSNSPIPPKCMNRWEIASTPLMRVVAPTRRQLLSLSAATLILFSIAATAALVPARRAARIDPLTALRED